MHRKQRQAVFGWLLRGAKGNLSEKRSDTMSAARFRPDVVVPMLFPLRNILEDKSAILLRKRICVFFNLLKRVEEFEIVARPFWGTDRAEHCGGAAFSRSICKCLQQRHRII